MCMSNSCYQIWQKKKSLNSTPEMCTSNGEDVMHPVWSGLERT